MRIINLPKRVSTRIIRDKTGTGIGLVPKGWSEVPIY